LNDQGWREKVNDFRSDALSIYEVHAESWRKIVEDNNRAASYRELAPMPCDYVGERDFTCIELMPLMEHRFLESSGYQVTGFFAPNPLL
jgi:1,4-alpha-glucan branching enzyme